MYEAHGSPPGLDELKAAKEKLGWPIEPLFYFPAEVLFADPESVASCDVISYSRCVYRCFGENALPPSQGFQRRKCLK